MTTLLDFPKVKISKTTKMPSNSYALPAQRCITGSKLRNVEGSTCEKCYAFRGNYAWANAKNLREYNYEHVMLCKNNTKARQDWINQLANAVSNSLVWRWHDSGDLLGMWHLEMINEVAKQAPDTKFWLPTREYGFVTDFLLEHGSFAPNLTVRLSAHMRGKAMTVRKEMQQAGVVGSTVDYDGGHQCPAPQQGGSCGSCRACWDRTVPSVNYKKH